jgi:NADH-quinone oxidoreductase subunit G
MIEVEVDGQKIEVSEGSMVMHAAEAAGVAVPHFCYHKKLSIAANCRMCLVDVEKAPKAVPACATPVAPGMVVRTRSDKAVQAQQSVMEFLLINHPLDCPICDQGGECQLQDLAVGYGRDGSRYSEEKRVVPHKEVGPLISMEEMSRCIHCTRCVRFGEEIAGDMELGMSHRGEHAEIQTFLGATIDSELSGNMIDICPVGALTSKPFRYSARTWELSRRKSISPHDSTGANLVVQVKNRRVMRVVPLENEAVNECWLADRDRFSYEALNSPERLTEPMIKQNGQWQTVDWTTALDYVARGLTQVKAEHGAHALGALLSPHSTLEELHLATQLWRGMGSDSVDHRLRHAQHGRAGGVRWLGMEVAELSQLKHALVVGSRLRKDHPLFAQRLRQAVRRGGTLDVLGSPREWRGGKDWAMPVRQALLLEPAHWVQAMAEVAAAVARAHGVKPPVDVTPGEAALAMAQRLDAGAAVLLGNAAAHHAQAESLLALAGFVAQTTGARVGYLTEAANTVGAQLVGAQPQANGLNAAQILAGQAKAVLLLHVEPEGDTAAGARHALGQADMVVSLNAFQTNMDVADVLLPVAPFTETSGSFVNAEGRVQSFHAVVPPLGQTRPAWKVLRVLGNLLGVAGMAQEQSTQVLAETGLAPGWVDRARLDNATGADVVLEPAAGTPCVAPIYGLDGLVRRAPALQATHDAQFEGTA